MYQNSQNTEELKNRLAFLKLFLSFFDNLL